MPTSSSNEKETAPQNECLIPPPIVKKSCHSLHR
jgi:hypothetical protein